MHRKEGGRSTQTAANCVQKEHGLPEDGQRAGQGAGTACVLRQGAQCHHVLSWSPWELMYPQVSVRGSAAPEQTVAVLLGLMARDEFTP